MASASRRIRKTDVIRVLLEKADVQGYLTTEDLMEAYPEITSDADRMESILMALRRQGVDVLDDEEPGHGDAEFPVLLEPLRHLQADIIEACEHGATRIARRVHDSSQRLVQRKARQDQRGRRQHRPAWQVRHRRLQHHQLDQPQARRRQRQRRAGQPDRASCRSPGVTAQWRA